MTIKDKVIENVEVLKSFTDYTQLRDWAFSNNMNNQSAFPKFKKALLEIGINYEYLRTSKIIVTKEELRQSCTHEITLFSDAKVSSNRYAVCDEDGNVLIHGYLFDNGDADGQINAELSAANRAIYFAFKVREAINVKVLTLNLIVNAQWLTYQNKSNQKGYKLTYTANKLGIILDVTWIRGKNNPADKWTISSGYKKWDENDLKSLAKLITDESTSNSAMDDGTGLPGLNQGKVQSNSEVQQGNNRSGSGVDNDKQSSAGDGESTSGFIYPQ